MYKINRLARIVSHGVSQRAVVYTTPRPWRRSYGVTVTSHIPEAGNGASHCVLHTFVDIRSYMIILPRDYNN